MGLKRTVEVKGVAYDRKQTDKHHQNRYRRPDCVTEIRMGRLRPRADFAGFFKQGATDTAADKMMKVLEAEAATQKTAI